MFIAWNASFLCIHSECEFTYILEIVTLSQDLSRRIISVLHATKQFSDKYTSK